MEPNVSGKMVSHPYPDEGNTELPKRPWVHEYLRFLSKMGRKNPGTFLKDFPLWNLYVFWPGLTRRAPAPPVLQCKDVQEAVRAFYRDGFVVLSDGLTPDEAGILNGIVKRKADEIVRKHAEGTLPPFPSHGAKRYSFGDFGHSHEWEYLASNAKVVAIVNAIWRGHAYRAVAAGGDFVLPGGTWQSLHNDNSWNGAGERLPRVITVNFYVSEVRPSSGPIRQVPGTARFPVPPNRVVTQREPAWMKESLVTGKPGYVVIRDPRAWHGGTPNTSSEPRYMPNVEYVLRDVPIGEVGGSAALEQLRNGKVIAEFPNT